MKLIITEKPNVGLEIAKIIGATKRQEGYFEGNGYIVTWALGHLIGLSQPEDYDAKYINRNDLSILPIVPKGLEFKTVVLKETAAQFKIVKELLNRGDVELIIDAGDDGPQGYYLQWLIRRQASCAKAVKKLFTSSLTESNIRQGLNNLRDIREFDGQIRYAYNAAKEDWLIGMNFSRLYTILYKRHDKEYFTVGRVQTPTLNFVVQRYKDNKNFIPENYFKIEVMSDEGIKWKILDDANKEIQFSTETEAETVKEQLEGAYINEIQNRTEDKATKPPKLYDITSLERDGVKKYGMSPAYVLETAQSIYMKKLITYPRTESNYITTDMEDIFAERVSDIVSESTLCQECINAGYDFKYFVDNKVIDNKKVTDHHAIIITENYKNYNKDNLNTDEKRVLEMITSRMLLASSKEFKYRQFVTEGVVGNYKTKTSYNHVVDEGFKYLSKKLNGGETDDKEISEDEFTEGNTYNISSDRIYEATVEKKKTTPPPLFTEDSLLKMMEDAGETVEDEELKAVLKGHGIGTKATRAGIIEELKKREYIRYSGDKKVKQLVPTEKGEYLISIVHDDLKSAELSARLEEELHRVERGSFSEQTCIEEFISYMNNIIQDEIKKNNIDMSKYESRITDIRCYFCKSPVGENTERYFCTNPQCGKINIYKKNNFITNCSKKELSAEDMQTLLSTGELKAVECKNKYPGKPPYKANFRINPKFVLKGKENLINIYFDKEKEVQLINVNRKMKNF